MTTTILVEGESDRVALTVLARRLGHDLPSIRVLGGAQAAATAVAAIRRERPQERIVGLVDAGERAAFERVITSVFVCNRDLEDELIRALGVEAVLAVIATQDELESFRTLQRQTAQRDRDVLDQLRRFLSGRSGNKARYAALLTEAVAPHEIPLPLKEVLAAATEA